MGCGGPVAEHPAYSSSAIVLPRSERSPPTSHNSRAWGAKRRGKGVASGGKMPRAARRGWRAARKG
eukprot:scaffold112609_cov30-Phaeocystis_antarctica.AAC.1